MKSIVLIFITSIIISSCSIGNGNEYYNVEPKFVLTESNYIFEGDLYKYFLKIQIDSLDKRANELKSIIDNGQANEDIKLDYSVTIKKLDDTKATNALILSYQDVVGKLGPKTQPPRPPAPSVIPRELKYVISYKLSQYDLVILDKEGKEIITLENGHLENLPGTDGILQIQNVEVFDTKYIGNVTLKANRVNNAGETDQYNYDAKIIQ